MKYMERKYLGYKSSKLPLIKFPQLAKKIYDNGNKLEGYMMLYGHLEFLLYATWLEFVRIQLKNKITPREWSFNDLIDLLYETKVIDVSEKSILKDFHKGRNEITHHLYTFSKKIDFKNIDSRFKKGLKIHTSIFEKMRALFLKEV